MKPHEEEWSVDVTKVNLQFSDRRPFASFGPDIDMERSRGAQEARARLVAQAPAMARQLFKHQYGGLDDCGYPTCPECDQLDPQYIGQGIDPKDAYRCGHKPDCELARVLRDAGVIP